MPPEHSLAICIPTYNRAELLRDTLLHLAEHRDLFQELVICDNASPDHTPSVVEELRSLFNSVIYVRHAENLGYMRNFNAVLSLTRCTYQYLLSDDDRLIPDGLRAGLARLVADPQAVAVFGGYEELDEAGQSREYRSLGSEPVRYTSVDRLAMAQTYVYMWHPIFVTAAYQRHCFYDANTFGFWRIIGQLLDVGAVWVLPDYFYRHSATAECLELQVIEPWYLEFHRSDLELFLAQLAVTDEMEPFLAHMVTNRMQSVLNVAMRMARALDRPLLERNFILRRRAYGHRQLNEERDWEQRAMVAGALERVAEQLRATARTRVFVEIGTMNLSALISRLEAALPGIAITELDQAALINLEVVPGDALIAQEWSLFEARRSSAAVEDDGVLHISWRDVLTTLRLTTDQGMRLLTGPDGTAHLVRL